MCNRLHKFIDTDIMAMIVSIYDNQYKNYKTIILVEELRNERQNFWRTSACRKIIYVTYSLLPVAGLFLGIGGSFTNETMLNAYGLMGIMGPGTLINAFLSVLNAAGNIVFANLPLLFAMGVAIGMAKKEKEVAALSGALAFLIMHASIGALININGGAEAMLRWFYCFCRWYNVTPNGCIWRSISRAWSISFT